MAQRWRDQLENSSGLWHLAGAPIRCEGICLRPEQNLSKFSTGEPEKEQNLLSNYTTMGLPPAFQQHSHLDCLEFTSISKRCLASLLECEKPNTHSRQTPGHQMENPSNQRTSSKLHGPHGVPWWKAQKVCSWQQKSLCYLFAIGSFPKLGLPNRKWPMLDSFYVPHDLGHRRISLNRRWNLGERRRSQSPVAPTEAPRYRSSRPTSKPELKKTCDFPPWKRGISEQKLSNAVMLLRQTCKTNQGSMIPHV